MNDHGLEQLVHFLTRKKKHIGFNYDFSPGSVCRHPLPGQTQLKWHCFWNFESSFLPSKVGISLSET